MKNNQISDVEKKFQSLQKIEQFLVKNVNGYLGKTHEFSSFADYKADAGGQFSDAEKIRVSDSIKLHKAMVMFQREHGELPAVDMFASQTWQSQLKGQSLLSDNNISMEIFGDIRDGQLMVHNKVSNTHSLISFEFVFDKDDKYGHIQLSQEDKVMFPMLESALRGQILINGTHYDSLHKSKNTAHIDHLNIDTAWMMDKIGCLTKANEIIQEVSASTGPQSVSLNRESMGKTNTQEMESLGM